MLETPLTSLPRIAANHKSETSRLLITVPDAERLLLQSAFARNRIEEEILHDLELKIRHTIPVDPESVPPDVVTMNSHVRLRDVETGRTMNVILAFPSCADRGKGRISVLTPLGAALLGVRTGHVFTCPVAGVLTTLAVEAIRYQPEAHGDYYG